MYEYLNLNRKNKVSRQSVKPLITSEQEREIIGFFSNKMYMYRVEAYRLEKVGHWLPLAV